MAIIYKQIKDHPNYWASDDGYVWYGSNPLELQPINITWSTGHSHLHYGDVIIDGSTYRLHRVIAQTFINDKLSLRYIKGSHIYINHLSGDTRDNRASNIEITSSSENSRHAVYKLKKRFGYKCRPVVLLDDSGYIVNHFQSIHKMMRFYGVTNPGPIYIDIVHGYKFRKLYTIQYEDTYRKEI